MQRFNSHDDLPRKPGPERKVERVRTLTSEVAVVQATTRGDAVTLPDGAVIPPHGEPS